jgi:hypothetical protein
MNNIEIDFYSGFEDEEEIEFFSTIKLHTKKLECG